MKVDSPEAIVRKLLREVQLRDRGIEQIRTSYNKVHPEMQVIHHG